MNRVLHTFYRRREIGAPSVLKAAAAVLISLTPAVQAASAGAASTRAEPSYLHLSEPVPILTEAQPWEGDQQPHTLSVLALGRGGYRYWGWFGLNNGRGIGLARSNDLLHWTKVERNPLWRNARWASALEAADPAHPEVLYFAITRDYDSPSSRIVLASSTDGIHLQELGDLVAAAPAQRNQNPNLLRDPQSGRIYLTFYRGNDVDSFDIVSKNALRIQDLARAPERKVMHRAETVAAPTLLFVPNGNRGGGTYYLATETYPGRYAAHNGGWQVEVFASDKPDEGFRPVAGNPVESGERACLFQHVFEGRFVGFQSHLQHPSALWEMEMVTAPLPGAP
jgi:hypothetical protein